MAWIRTVDPGEAEGLLAKLYRAAIDRAGKVFGIVGVQSLRPHVMRASTQLYVEVLRSERSPLSRVRRETIATVVSRLNGCHY